MSSVCTSQGQLSLFVINTLFDAKNNLVKKWCLFCLENQNSSSRLKDDHSYHQTCHDIKFNDFKLLIIRSYFDMCCRLAITLFWC